MYNHCNIPIYFCNIHLHRTYETFTTSQSTFATSICIVPMKHLKHLKDKARDMCFFVLLPYDAAPALGLGLASDARMPPSPGRLTRAQRKDEHGIAAAGTEASRGMGAPQGMAAGARQSGPCRRMDRPQGWWRRHSGAGQADGRTTNERGVGRRVRHGLI
jgi:hypothetical protein